MNQDQQLQAIRMRSQLLHVASLCCEIVPDAKVTTTRVEDLVIRVNPAQIDRRGEPADSYAFQHRFDYLRRAVIQRLLCHDHTPEDPRNKGELGLGASVMIEPGELAAPRMTLEEARRFSSAIVYFCSLEPNRHHADEDLWKALQERGIEAQRPEFDQESLSQIATQVMSGQSPALPTHPFERLWFVHELAGRPQTIDEALVAFHWLIDNIDAEWIIIFTGKVMSMMREKHLQSQFALAIQKDMKMRKFLSEYAQLLGLGGR